MFESKPMMRFISNPWLAASMGLLLLMIDLATKFLTQLFLPLRHMAPSTYPYGGIGVFKNFMGIEFSLIHQTNRGAAWGVLSDFQVPLLVLRIALVIGLVAYLFLSKKHPTWRVPMALIVAGALGNILDYFLYGHVIDMFLFKFWGYDYPVFNVADSAIFIGIFWLFFASFFDKPSNQNP